MFNVKTMFSLLLRVYLNPESRLPSTIVETSASISLFSSLYGDIQTSQEKSIDFRRDIFYFCREVEKFKTPLTKDDKQKLWMMLLIAAISGSSEEILQSKQTDSKSDDSIFLGLRLDAKNENFEDYSTSYSRLRSKFSNEADNISGLVKFIREKF